MKKQAIYTPDTLIMESSQAAGYLHEDLKALDYEELWGLFLNSANIPLTKKMITPLRAWRYSALVITARTAISATA